MRNNFVGVIENIKWMFLLIAGVGAALCVTGSSLLLNVFSLASAPALAVMSAACFRKEALSKWNKYKLSLPVRRREIIQSYYIGHLIWCGAGMVVTAMFMALTVLIHGNQYFYYGLRDAVTLIIGGGVLATLTGSVSYPMLYALGEEKTEFAVAASVAGAIAVVVGLSGLINILAGDGGISDRTYYLSLSLIVAVTGISYFLSYRLSVVLFRQKEY